MDIYATVIAFNTVDILMALVVVAVITLGRKGGIVSGFIKLFGVFCTIFITVHYYARLAGFFRNQFLGKDGEAECFAFILLAILISLIFFFISKGWILILKIKSFEVVDRWGGLVLSLIRAYFICGLIFIALVLSNQAFLTSQASQSVSRFLFRESATGFYKISYSVVIKNLFRGEEMNSDVFKLIGEYNK